MSCARDSRHDSAHADSAQANPLRLAPGGRSASLQSSARAGAVLAGRLTIVDGERIGLDASVAANIEFADAFADCIRKAVDDAIAANGLDLRADGIDSVVWCTGYTGNFSWLDARSQTPRDTHP